LQRLLYSSARPVPSPLTQQALAEHRLPEVPLVPLEDFKEAEKQGDNIEFALLVALACERAADTPLPLCDACMEATLKAKSRAFHDACDDRDSIIHLRDMVASRLQLSQLSDDCVAETDPAGATGAVSSSSGSARRSPPVHAALRAAIAGLDEEEEALHAEIAASEAALSASTAQSVLLDTRLMKLESLEARTWGEIACTSRSLQAARAHMQVRTVPRPPTTVCSLSLSEHNYHIQCCAPAVLSIIV
jgi:hypothetical protein